MILPFVSIIITVFFFATLIKIYEKNIGLVENVGLSFLLGLGIETVVFFGLFNLNDYVSVVVFWIVKVIELTLALLFTYLYKVKLFNKYKIKFNFSIFIWIIIFLLFLLSLIYTLYTPVHTTDSLYFFDFRSKIMFLTKTISGISIIPNWSFYPMFTSMVGLMSRLSGSDNPSFYYPFMYLSFALVFYSCLRRFVGINLSSLLTLLMYSTPILYWQSRLDGMVNMPYSVFVSLGFIYNIQLLSGYKNKHIFIVAMFGLALSRWVRIQEPFWLLPLIFLVAKMVYDKKWIYLGVGLLVFFSISSVWPNYIKSTAIELHGVNTSVGVDAALNTIISSSEFREYNSFVGEFFSVLLLVTKSIALAISPVSYLLPIFILLIIFIKKEVQPWITLLLLLGSWGLLVVSVFYSTFVWGTMMIELTSSLSRLTGLFVPLCWYFISVIIVNLLRKYRIIV